MARLVGDKVVAEARFCLKTPVAYRHPPRDIAAPHPRLLSGPSTRTPGHLQVAPSLHRLAAPRSPTCSLPAYPDISEPPGQTLTEPSSTQPLTVWNTVYRPLPGHPHCLQV